MAKKPKFTACSACDQLVWVGAKSCSLCGQPNPASKPQSKALWRYLVPALLLVGLTAAMIMASGSPLEKPKPAALDSAPPTEVPRPAKLAALADFQVIKDESFGGVKRSVEVELLAPVSRAMLARIGRAIQADTPSGFARTFIGYYLVGDDRRDLYWATTHFNPDLQVNIQPRQ